MTGRLPPHYVQLVWEATHKSFWRRQSLHDFLRRCGVKEGFLSSWTPDESKRDFLTRLFPRMEATDAGRAALNRIADALAEQRAFPDLEGWDETPRMKEEAHRAVSALRLYKVKAQEDATATRERQETRHRAAEIREQQVRQQQHLSKLQDRLDGLAARIGSAEGGYAFQDWFFDLVAYFEIDHRRPFKTDGREIDGSVTHDGTTYLCELKFAAEAAGAPGVEVFRRKVETKADNTMGIMVSMAGFTGPAVTAAGGERSPILLLSYQHLYAVLGGVMKLGELISRVRRYASQTGRPYFELDELG